MKRMLQIVTLAALVSCRPAGLIDRWADPKAKAIAENYIERLAKDDTTLAAELAPQYRNEQAAAVIKQMAGLIPKEPPTSKELVGYNMRVSSDTREYDLTYQFGYRSKWILVMTGWHDVSGGTREITTLRVQPLQASLQEINAFTFRYAGVQHYIFAAGAILIPLFVLTTLVVCIRTRFAGRKWPWVIFILFGMMQVTLNWTTGGVGFTPLSVLLFGASAVSPGMYGPWLISISLPVGAIAFWLRRKTLRADDVLVGAKAAAQPGTGSSSSESVG